ncbi:LETM1 domain-containing protein mdm28, mitochondrial [Orbilia oligospora]|uniref:LETM1 domain-containing protein mdm28, mitochondrial n=1 Tax=Orbilia oligospora TaxID=2813651 RepID=A0A7C8KWR1_ORBOL|nr:LETM1 domain-containing protein mdm28, mitochondrial [Orbilia oligospora]KAF3195328.1 LETM1 domain-containing protein mdm28, mitochondrial [Orbilia oligospora]KAF3267644.1 LETM1 domain-containing protein mdm28, mitochondrial [Orbilia oligospora]KAF3269152.1 LETM1 domain-containing protein mdm28, mitochondrial [Orbilia oligospora]TGJ63117.1 LETM1 domain-containing protein mdm28, mitochondrial [Orbilia oligospora]
MSSHLSARLVLTQRSLLTTNAHLLRRTIQRNPHYLRAIAISVPHNRLLSTETSPHGSIPSGPPPGFNAKQAQKPLPRDKAPAKTSQASAPQSTNKSLAKESDVVSPNGNSQVPIAVESKTEGVSAKDEKKDSEKEKKKEGEKLTLWQKVKKEANHYWDGTKLLGTEIKISTKLVVKMAAGYELSRREHRQLQRTVQDIVRLVPFSVFVIVPFAELLLPVAIKLFPNMLPSTYEGEKDKERKNKILRATRKDVSDFLRTTLQESGLPLSLATRGTEEFTEFFRKLKSSGEKPTHQDVINVCKTFKDDLTLDNLSRPQLVAMCRYMNLNAFGTDMMLRYTIRHRMRQIKRDDRAIFVEGVNSLSVPELQTACASRGMRTHGVSPSRLREDLQTWLDLRLKHGIPSALLVLSNAYVYAEGKGDEIESHYDALTAVLSGIPEELYHEVELDLMSGEGAATNKQRLEVLKEQQELIEEENTQSEESGGGRVSKRLDQDIDEKPEQKAKEEGSGAEAAEAAKTNEDLANATERHEGTEEGKKEEAEKK